MKESLLKKRTKSPIEVRMRFQYGSIMAGVSKLALILLILASNSGIVKALPSYARQTGMSCTACHNSFPELNGFGRQFKLNGYTLTGMQTIEAKEDSDKVTRLKLLSTLPLSAMFQSSYTSLAKDVTGVQNNSVAFPQQLSLFLSGQVTPHIGTFIQMTYSNGSFGMDNTDIRYSDQTSIGTKNLLYGVTLNNNPAVQDVWNTSPAWRFPSATSSAAVNPSKSTILEGLGTKVAGLGLYSLYDGWLFTELSLYRSAQQGASNPADSTNQMVLKGVAPYWRAALQHQWGNDYFELGTFGIASNHFQQGIKGAMDNFVDLGFDFQYEHNMPIGSFTLHSALINESETRDDSAGVTSNQYNFSSFKIDANLYLKKGLGATVGYFNTSGKEDPRITNPTMKPNSNGFIFQLEYLPWYNTKFSIQYVMYNKFDGSTSNYDGAGRNAADNNTLYILAWYNF